MRAGQVVREPEQQVGGRLGVRQRAVAGRELDAEEVRQGRRACSSRGPDTPRGRRRACPGSVPDSMRVPSPRASSRNPMSKPTEWPTSGALPTKSSALRAASAGVGAPLTSLSVMPCIWLPTIGRPALTKVDQRSVILPPLTRTAATSTRSAILGSVPVVSTSTTTNSPPAFASSANLSTESVSGLEVRQALGLADDLAQLLLEIDERDQRPVPEHDGLGHDVLGEDLDARLDHHDRVAGARDDEVELGVLTSWVYVGLRTNSPSM